MSVNLPVYQQVALLAIHDDKGTFQAEFIEHLLAGAIFAELMLQGCVTVTGKDKRVSVVTSLGGSDKILSDTLDLLKRASKPLKIKNAVVKIAGQKNLKHEVARSLCDAGILKVEQDKILLVFTRQVYPEVNPVPEQQIKQALHKMITHKGNEVMPRMVVLMSLLQSSGLLKKHFDKAFLKQYKERIERIAKGDVVGAATKEVIEACQMVIIMTAILPAMTSTVIAN